ncbi:MAG TPA: DUF2127 domain-containing protein, partial [Terracidiphilus sp.]|nr:DUF2127 domain-containing protein [Terracidiphilus sp.]
MKGTNRKIFRIYGTTVPRRTLRSLGSCSRNRLTYSQARTFCAAPAEVIIKTPAKRKRGRLPSNKLLLLIALYKFFQAAIIALIGFGAMRLLHKDFGDVMLQVASALRFNPESRFVNFVLDRASVVDDHLLRRIGVVAFCYAGLSLAEGIGL